ncbi:CHAD domain-containing protein [Streptomyces physcomitrii]|uniref:CHAD domain-containing protein n=1 Tax=Streptomyces physcomitrii TaxID=2724184 RepID=UPI00342402E6
MAQQHHEVAVQSAAGDVLAAYLRHQATEFLRALRAHREHGGTTGSGEEASGAAAALRASARRIGGTLHTFKSLLDGPWSEEIRAELAWLSGTLAREHAHAARLERLLGALHRLSGSAAFEDGPAGAVRAPGPRREDRGGPPLAVGAAKAGALLERQLTLARTRAHSAALGALGSARFHALADSVAVLASEVPVDPNARAGDLHLLAREAKARLDEAAQQLPLRRAGLPYNAEALVHGLSAEPGPQPQDAPWHQVRLLLRLHRYAHEVLHAEPGAETETAGRLRAAGRALDEHRDAAEAALAAASAARTPRIAPATAYALGVLHAEQRHAVEAARYAFGQCWLGEKEPVATG